MGFRVATLVLTQLSVYMGAIIARWERPITTAACFTEAKLLWSATEISWIFCNTISPIEGFNPDT